MSKKIISVLLAVVMVLAMGTVAIVSASAKLTDLPEVAEGCNRYFFYMPTQWYNDYANKAGIYWWAGQDACSAWPGYEANAADAEGVFYYDVPASDDSTINVSTIIWNNYLDGGTDKSLEVYTLAYQTKNIGSEYYDPGESATYPDGTDSFDGMIYVIDLSKTEVNDYSGKSTYSGEWYYYYGDGKYGTAPVEGDSEILTDRAINENLFKPEATEDETDPVTTESTAATEATAAATDATETNATEATEPKTEAVITPAVSTTVNVDGTAYYGNVGEKLTYKVDITAARLFENIQATVAYDSKVLELTRVTSDDPDVEDWEVEGPLRCPNLDGVIFNASAENIVKFNASKVAGYNFKEGANLVNLEFTVIGEGDTSIDLVIEEMTIKGGEQSYFEGGQAVITDGVTVKQYVEGLPTEMPTSPVVTDPTTAPNVPTTVAPTEKPVGPTDPKPTVTKPAPTTPAPTTIPAPATDPTSTQGTTAGTGSDTVPTGSAAYIYVVLAVIAMASCAVVVLRKKVNG